MQKSKKNWVIIELAIRYGRKKSRKDILSFCFFCTEIQHRLNISRGDDMDIVQITDRILASIGIGMSAAFQLFRFSIMTLMPAIEDIKTDVLLEGLSLERVLIITVSVLVSISPTFLAIKNRGQRVSLCHLQIFLLVYLLCTYFYDLWKIKHWLYGCIVLIFCINLTWCVIGFCQEYVPKFGTHKRKKDSEKSRLEH